jgi:hypothetical protein
MSFAELNRELDNICNEVERDNASDASDTSSTSSEPNRLTSTSQNRDNVVSNMATVRKEARILNLDQASKFVPEFNGRRDDLSKFVSCGDFAIENIEESYAPLLLEIITNKLVGDAYNIIRFKKNNSWEQLKVALKDKYGDKKNIAHLQLEMSSARQQKDEDVRAFSERLNTILSSLAIQMTENRLSLIK